jgi:hypothetical protein
MSVVEPGQKFPTPKVVRWSVYGLATVGGVVVVASGGLTSPPFTAVAIVVAFAPLALTLWAPELFVVITKPKRGPPVAALNPIAGIPAAALFFRAVGLDLMDFGPSWIAAGAGAAVFAAVAWLRRPAQTPIQLLLYLTLFGLFLGYGAATQADVAFDTGQGVPYQAMVMDMRITGSRTTSYTVELAPWGPLTGWNWQDVPRSVYRAAEQGVPLCPRLHPGVLHERWFTIDLCPDGQTPAAPAP